MFNKPYSNKTGKSHSNRKGDINVLMLLIIAAVVSIIALVFSYLIATTLNRAGDIEACHLSVLANAKVQNPAGKWIPVAVSSETISIDCPTERVKIDQSKIRETQIPNTEIAIKHIVAEEMRKCWYKMGEGKLKPFNEDYIKFASEKFCVVCSEIDFDPEVRDEVSQVKGFARYLIDTPLNLNTEQSYATYLNNGVRVTGSVDQPQSYTTITDWFGTREQEVVLFSMSKEDLWKRTLSIAGGTGAGLATGVGIFLLLVPEPSISKITAITLLTAAGGALTLGGAGAGYMIGVHFPDYVAAVSVLPASEVNKLECDHLYRQ